MILGPQLRQQLVQLAQHAHNPKHIFRSGRPGSGVPNHDPHHFFVTTFGYRVVYSLTAMPWGDVYRHLSLSVSGGGYPSTLVAFPFARLLGFTGWNQGAGLPHGWQLQLNPTERCLALVQRIDAFACPRCDAVSYNPNDLAYRYCGACHSFAPATEPAPKGS